MEVSAERADRDWARDLAATGPEGEASRAALRALLVRGLHQALAGRAPQALPLVEDFAQEALLRILAHLEDYRGEGRFTSWALAISVRVAFNEIRRQRWRDVPLESIQPESAGAPELLVDAAPSPDQEVARKHVLKILRHALDADLTPRQRQVLAAELRGMPQSELARQLGTNRNALYKLGHDARRRLKRVLEEAGLSAEHVQWAFDL
jgi:RNA polymerase sigma-70 factor (ECF subfamily)